MSDTSTYESDVLARYKFSSAVSVNQNQFNESIEITLENGHRLWLSPRIRWNDMGAHPYIEITSLPDSTTVFVPGKP